MVVLIMVFSAQDISSSLYHNMLAGLRFKTRAEGFAVLKSLMKVRFVFLHNSIHRQDSQDEIGKFRGETRD